MKNAIVGVVALLAFFALAATTASAVTDEEKCQFKLVKEKEKYEKCVTKWLGKVYSNKLSKNSNDAPTQEKLAKCRIKYQNAWEKKLLKLEGTSCDPVDDQRFVDNGDTVFDRLTGLTWEKKGDIDSGVHDKDDQYRWSTADLDHTDEDGEAFTEFLLYLNETGFDGAAGWRFPTFAELQTILLPEPYPCPSAPVPCIHAVFDDTNTNVNYHWTSTTYVPDDQGPPTFGPSFAWSVAFNSGQAAFNPKTEYYAVRAVRGGW